MIDLELKSKIDEELHDLHNSEQLRTKAADDSGFSFTPIEDGEEPDVDLKVAPEGFSFTPIEDDFDPWKIKPQHIFSVDGKNTNAAEKMDIVEKSWVKKFAESGLGKFGNTMFQSSARGIFETLKGFGDMATFYGDNMIISKDSQELLGLSDATVNRLNSFGRLWQSAGEKIKQAGDFVLSSPELQLDEEIFEGDIVENPSVTRFASAAMSAAPSLLFMTRIAAATKSPALAYYLMAGSESGDLYAEARNTGDQNKANLLFTGSVAGTALIDFVFKPLDAIMGKTSSSLKSKVFQRIKAGFLESMPESLQQVWQNFVRKYGIDDTQNLMEGVIESAIGGFGAGAALAGAYQYADAREGLKNKGASDEEINRLIDASTYVLENNADAANDAVFQHINERLDNLNKFIEENKGTAEAQKALQTKQELESIYDDVFNALKDKTGENNAAASARIWQGFALFASQETGMSPKEYITDNMPKIVKMNYNDFNSQTQRYRTRNANENWANIVRDIKAARGKKVADDRMTLTEFLVSRGGIKDEGGELSALDAVVAADMGKKGKRLKREEKRLVREDGLSLDYAREAAAEAGYLPADADVNTLLSALDDEFRGRPHYLLTETNSAAIDEREALRNYEMAFEAAGVDIEADSPDTIRRKMDAYAARKKEDEVLAKVGLLSDDLQERYFILRENDVNAEEAYAEVMRENGDLATLVDDDIPFQYQKGKRIRKIDAERLAFERKDINPDLIGRENEVKEAVDINRFFADRKASKEIGIDEVMAAVDANVRRNENGVRVLKNSVTGETVTLSNSAISKMFSSTSNRLDSQNIGGILGKEAIANIGSIFDTAMLIKTTPDAKHGSKNKIRRYANVIRSDGENFIVKMTVKEMANKRPELTDIEIEDNGGRDLSAYDMKVGRKNTAEGNISGDKSPTFLNGNDISINDLIDFVNSYSEDSIQIDGKNKAARNSAGRRIARTEEGLRAFYEWFGDSKVVDENGQPLKMVHFSGNEFSQFDKNRTGINNDESAVGFWFADKDDFAFNNEYHPVRYDVYLKMDNPLVIEGTGTETNPWADTDIDNLDPYAKFEKMFNDLMYQDPQMWDERVSESFYGGYEKQKIKLHFANLSEGRKREVIKSIVDKLKTQGYDGIIIKNTRVDSLNPDEGINQYVVFEPNQIKSVDNRGSFSRTDDNIYYQTGAEFGWPDYREIEASEPYIGYKKYAEDVRNMIQDDVKYADLQMSINRVGGISSYISGETKDGEAFRIRISDHDTNYDTADISFYYSGDKNKFIERWQKFLKQPEQRKAKAEQQEAARKEYIAENLPKEYMGYYRQYGLKALKKAVNEGQLPPFKFTFNDEQQKIYGTLGISWRDVKQFIEENPGDINNTVYQTGEPLTEYAYEKGGRAYNKQQLKENQLEVVKEKNPAPNEYQTWIRSVEDIKTFDEVIGDDESFVWGDYTREDALRDLERGEVTVYSSNDIMDGNFVSTSYRQALDYAGGDAKNVREATLPLNYIAWINGDEGQVAITSTVKKRLEKTPFQTGNRSDMLNLETEAVQGQGEDRINSIPKGAYSPQMNVIYLFENADASTFMHESSHFFKKQLKYFAGKSEKSAQLLKAVEDWENSEFDRQFVIDEKDGDFRVLDKNGIIIHEGFKSADLARNYAKEELFARGFEQFLREGKAPSNYLKRVFDMFLNWLRRIYTTAKEMRVKINKDISAVYGDILGGEDLDYYLQAPIDEVVNYNREKAIEERRKMDEVYKAANRDYAAGKNKLQKTVQQILKDAKDFTQDAIVPLEEVVKSISPELWTKNRRLEIAKLQKNSQYVKRVKGFFDKAQKLTPEVFNKLDLALKNRDVETVAGILSENDMTDDFTEVRKVLDELREQMIEVGVEINYLPDYFPRKLRDADGLLDYLRQKYEGKPEYSKIMQVLEEKSKDGRIRSEEDRAQIVNSLFRGYGGTISLANIGNAKERSIDLIDAEMNKYYKNSVDALVDYVSGAINLTENKKYFGKEAEDVQILRRRVANRKTTIAEYEKMDAKEAKWKEIKTRNYKIGAVDAQIRNTYDDLLRQDLEERKARLETEVEFLKNRKAEQVKEIALRRMNEELKTLEDELSEKADNTIEESVGNLLYDLAKDGVITHTQEMRLKELLVARFSNKGLGNEFLRMLRDGGYIWTLGNVGSAITQFGDLGSAVYKAGFWNTMFENVKAWQGKSEITLEDLGLNKVITDGGYVDTSKLTKYLDKVLKYTGFEKIDGISKMTLVNAAVNKARRDAQSGSKELEEYLRVEFGNRWKEVANDLKEGRKTPEIIEYAMFQLMDVQPVTIDQMPKFYAEGGKKRMFYMMKSYFIKQLNEYRKICFETAKTNPQKAFVDLMRLTLWLMLFNAGADFLKDLLFGREIDVTDTLLENVFVGGSINRYTGMSIKRNGLFKTIQDQLAFPVIFDEIIKDVLSNRDVADYKSWRNVPLIGNPYYYWFGGGSK